MSKLDISKVSRNKYIVDTIDAIQTQIDDAKVDFHTLEQGIMILSSEKEVNEWEKWFKLDKDTSLSLQDRIDRLIFTFNSRGYFTEGFLRSQANIFTHGEIDIKQDYPNYHFDIQFTSMIGTPPNINNFNTMVDLNKPAHLTWGLYYRFRTHGELAKYTHEQLHRFTHEELRSRALVNTNKEGGLY